jgi:lipid II:glycine glycyltransferase (peptidoglycan interpeptide bridge formation enzyme)
MLKELDAGYTSEVDYVYEDGWYELLRHFDDANIYQTWAYGVVRNGRENLSHLVVKSQGTVIALAQVRIVKVPLLGAGIAYVMWGPLWKRCNERSDAKAFRQVARALHNEYVCKRGLLVRLYPALFEEEHSWVVPILAEEGFVKVEGDKPPQTILMDLTPTIEELRKGIGSKKRRELRIAEQQMEVIEGTAGNLFEQFIVIYKEMVGRKQFLEPNDIYEFLEIQHRLPEEFKMRIMLCRSEEGFCAGLISSAIGSAALYLFGATSSIGMKSRGAYLLQWEQIEQLKKTHVRCYDLHGINPEANPGTYKFKRDLAGEKGREVRFLGRFESCESQISWFCVSMGEKLRAITRALI